MMRRWFLLLCLVLPLSAQAAVQASLDRNDVHLGETVTLTLRVDGSADDIQPDLSALNQDFEVLGTSTNSMVMVDNGRPSSQLIFGVALRPRHQGDLRIPALTVGSSQTSPLTVHVSAPDASSGGAVADARKNVFVEIQASANHAYVGQQLLLTVRLFFAVNLNSGSLADPGAVGAQLRKMGRDVDYDSDRGGRHYHVVERRYALVPQHAGTLSIPSIQFQGEAVDAIDPNDPASFFSRGGMFGNTTPVTADSNAISIDVKAALGDWGNTAWLPARTLSLKLDGFPAGYQVHVGEPLSLHMSLDASGVAAESLPELSLPTVAGATVYPDPSTSSTQDDGQWLTAHRSRSFTVFPQQAGSLVIPETTLTWFDTQTGQKQVATVPAHTVTVLPAVNAGKPAAAASSPVPAPAGAGAPNAVAAPATLAASPWRWVALGSIVLWLLSMLVIAAWWWRRRQRPVASEGAVTSSRSARNAFIAAARAKDVSAQARCLLAWARTERPALQNLGELSAALASASQQAAIAVLQRAQYAGATRGEGIDVARAFEHGFDWRKPSATDSQADLPPLYPFKLD